jgi:hypothetical protein
MKNLIKVLLLAVLVADVSTVQADSKKVFNKTNGHWYQRFDKQLTWHSAKSACEDLNAHLVTVASWEEQSFLADRIGLSEEWRRSWFGATNEPEGKWKWVTGETWKFTDWRDTKPPQDKPKFLAVNLQGWSYCGNDYYYCGANVDSYICEWDGNANVAIANVHDTNGNGAPEEALLYLDRTDNRHKVRLKDLETGGGVRTLTFQASVYPPVAIVALPDLNGNQADDIAVLAKTDAGKPSVVDIRDARTGEAVANFSEGSANQEPLAMSSVPDMNGDGIDELSVLLRDRVSGKYTSVVRDPKTQKVLKTLFW